MFDYFQLSDTKDYQYLLDSIGKDVTVNGSTPVRAIITNTSLKQNFDDKNISSLTAFHTGDIIDYDAKKWMVISEINTKRYNKFKGIMRVLPHSITFNSSCQFFTVNAYIDSKNFGVSNGNVVSLADANIDVYLSDSAMISGLKIDDRFILLGQVFKIAGMDRYSRKGLLILSCAKTLSNVDDDLVNGIAGGLACHVDIINGDTANVFVDSILQLNYTSTSDAPVTFTSSDESIATVNATGLVTGNSAGVATIAIANVSNGHITDTIVLTVEDVPVAKTITLTFDNAPINEIKINQLKTYTANIYEGATLQPSENVTWSIFADDQVSAPDTTTYQITATTGTTVTIKGLKNTFYIQLKCTLDSDPTVFVWQRIKLRALF